jgi:AmpE protein
LDTLSQCPGGARRRPMIFLAIIIALVLVQVWGSGSRLQHDDWFRGWQSRVATWDVGPKLGVALVIGLPVALAQTILNALEPALFGLLWIALAVVLLLYSFGRRDFHELMERYREQCRGADFEGAYLTTLSGLGWATEQDNPGSPQEVHELVQRGFFYLAFQRWFAVLFYFVLFGPAGALAYRLLQLCRQNFEIDLIERCIFFADWVPARLLAAAFTLTGDFVGSRDVLLNGLGDTSVEAGQLLYTVGTAALGTAPSPSPDETTFGESAAEKNLNAGRLISRSAACWVVVISLVVLLL